MPHIKLEITENLFQPDHVPDLMLACALALDKVGLFSSDDIKVRCYCVEHSSLGTAGHEHSYVAAEVQVLDNKSAEQLNQIMQNVQAALRSHFTATVGAFSITSRLTLMAPEYYQRWIGE